MRTYDEIKAAIAKKGFVFFTKEMDINLIWERTSDEVTNKFDDFLHVCYTENGIGKVLTIQVTTKAGMFGAFADPITVQGVTGTAVIIPGQYRRAYEFIDSYKGFTGYPYFRQVGPVNYWRDGNRDQVIDHVQEQDGKTFGTHIHKMSPTGKMTDYVCKPGAVWSKGCMGGPEPEWKKILEPTRRAIKTYGCFFTLTLLESKDFE